MKAPLYPEIKALMALSVLLMVGLLIYIATGHGEVFDQHPGLVIKAPVYKWSTECRRTFT